MKNIPESLVCIIPARAGSKGIPGKNLKLLAGMPLFLHSVIHALVAGIPKNQIVVTSDGDHILDLATTYGVIPCERPIELAQDRSPTEDALVHALQTVQFNVKTEHVLLLQPTSPVRFKGMITGLIEFYFAHRYDSVLTTTRMMHDFFWYQNIDGYTYHSNYSPKQRPMRQEVPYSLLPHFENGNAYLMNSSILCASKCRLAGEVGVYPISDIEGVQIDTQEEFEMIETMFAGNLAEMTGLKDAKLWKSACSR